MADADHDALRVTPLHALHRELGAKMVPFAGYDMPVQYPQGVLGEHNHTRAAAGLFDVSHMGQVRLDGAGAAAALETLVPADIAGLAVGRTRYTQFTDVSGGILDDLMVTNAGDHLFLVVNAACKAQDIAHMRAGLGAAPRTGGAARLGPHLPDLKTTLADAEVVESILQPSKRIDPDYAQVTVVTNDGKQLTGIKVEENDREVVLRSPTQPEPVRVPKSNVDEIVASPVSLMPAGLVQMLKDRREFNDLLRYVLETRGRQ